MLRKISLILIILSTACIAALTLNIVNSAEVDAEKAAEIAEISKKPSIVALATAMKSFRDSLSEELLADASYPLGHKESYSWSNLPPSRDEDRGGIEFSRLSVDQLARFNEVLNAFLSDEGYAKVSLITTKAATDIGKVKHSFWSSRPYFIALFGNPETDGSWGFQLDGHHLSLNFLVHGDEVTIVPTHLGTSPTTINGTVILEGERSNALALLNNLDANQKGKAIQTGRRGLKVGPGRTTDPFLNYDYSHFVGVGLKASEMNDTQKDNLRKLIKTYVYNLETEFADVWMKDIDAGFDDTCFVWIGGTTENDSIYYRVFNPAVWIEFNDEGRGTNHIHTITRSPNGKDYGIFALNGGPKTLLEHYAMADHHKLSNTLFDYQIGNLNNDKYKRGN
ncbi:MAG: DUF3500 domain-containing protein [Candidatus Poribacteria bacterium]|nr:DUF3500 domain-containing protein [Candidatus Poribacteria bacterium]